MILATEKRGTSVPLFFWSRETPLVQLLIILLCMSHLLRQPALDLFGEVPVTEEDIYDWVASVAPLHLSERSFLNYVRGYAVADKVRAAKLQGTFEDTKAAPIRPWHARLALHQIC